MQQTNAPAQDEINRVVVHESPRLLRPSEHFSFDGKVYTSQDESIMVRSCATTGKLFAPITSPTMGEKIEGIKTE